MSEEAKEMSVEEMEADLRVKFPKLHFDHWSAAPEEGVSDGWVAKSGISRKTHGVIGSGVTREAAIRDAWERHCKTSPKPHDDGGNLTWDDGERQAAIDARAEVDEGEKVDHPNLHAELPHPLPQARAKWLCEHRSALPPEPAPKDEKPLCDTTMTPRNPSSFCNCANRTDQMGPCDHWEVGDNDRCVYCDHELRCHGANNPNFLHPLESVPAPQSEVEVPKPKVGEVWIAPNGTQYRVKSVGLKIAELACTTDTTEGNASFSLMSDWTRALPEEPKPQEGAWVPVYVEQAICDLIPDESGRAVARDGWAWDDAHPDGKNALNHWKNEAITQRRDLIAERELRVHEQEFGVSSTPSSPAVSGTERERFEAWHDDRYPAPKKIPYQSMYEELLEEWHDCRNKRFDGWQASLSGRDSSVVPETISDSGMPGRTLSDRALLEMAHQLCECPPEARSSWSCEYCRAIQELIFFRQSSLASSTSTHNEGKDGGL